MDKSFLLKNYDEVLEFVNCLKIGVYITDGKGNTLLVNDESCKTGGLSREEVMGKNMADLEKLGFVKESVALKTLKSQKVEHMVQDLGDGGKVYVTSHPVFVNGKIDLIITTERDVTEVEALRKLLIEQEQTAKNYEEEIQYLRDRNMSSLGNVIAADVRTKLLVQSALRIAKLDTTVLLTGETGTGKEMFANLIYKNSNRAGKPFIKVDCASIPGNLIESELFGYVKGAFTGADPGGKKGYFELANPGTILLDEIGELPMHLQSKFLRVLQEREFFRIGGTIPIPLDIRVIAATKVNLLEAVKKGEFREDLFYRINVVPLEIPPLRERKQDISAIAEHYVNVCNERYRLNKRLSYDAIKALENYEWPGNIRELQNVIERSIISFDGDEITKFQIERILYPKKVPGYIPDIESREGVSIDEMLAEYEKYILETALKKYKNASKVSEILGMSKSTLCRRMKKYGLK